MLLIKNAKIYTMADEIIEKGDILVDNGKIQKVGQDLARDLDMANIEVLDAEGLIALPGLVDCHSHVGGMNFAHGTIDDSNEMTNKVTPDVQIIYGTDPTSTDFEYAYRSGITALGLTPGSGNVVCGLVCAAKTYGNNIFEMVIKNPIALKVAFGGNPKRTYGSRNQEPSTRMSIPVVLRDLFKQAQEYMNKKEEAIRENKELPKYDKKLEAVIPALKKEIPLKMHCTQFDMLAAIEVASEFDMDFTLEHAWGATDYMDEIVESGCGVVFGPIGSRKGFGESRLIDVESVIELDNRGVLTALTTDAPILSIDALIHHAGEAVREGCDVERALRMITINPAKIMGVDDRIGTIEEGKDADIVLFKGMPVYNTNAKVMYTIIDGKIVFSA